MTYINRNTNNVRAERNRQFVKNVEQSPQAEGNPNREQPQKDRGSDNNASPHEQNRKEHKEGNNG